MRSACGCARAPSARPLGSLRISPAGVSQQDGSTSAERNGFSLFAFPEMNRWAFFYRPAERDLGFGSPSIGGPHFRKVKRPKQRRLAWGTRRPAANLKRKTPSNLIKEEGLLRASLSCRVAFSNEPRVRVGDAGHGRVFSPKWPLGKSPTFGKLGRWLGFAPKSPTFAKRRQIWATGYVGHQPTEGGMGHPLQD